MNGQNLPMLPPLVDLETNSILKQLARASRALSELKGYSDTIPNKNMLLNAIMLNEAKDSSAIENIVTTHDDLFRAVSDATSASAAAREVVNYRTALWQGYIAVKANGFLTTNMMVDIQCLVERSSAGIRRLPGTVLRNAATGEVVYTPPVGESTIRELLGNLEQYINTDADAIDPLIKMAVVHYQFESIHPFYDGNGRTGRIINVLYLVLKGLLDSPILYLSSYIIRNKSRYYNLLQEVRTEGNWEGLIIYLLAGIEETAMSTLQLIKKINAEVAVMTLEIKGKLPKMYSRELIDLLFFELYTKITYVEQGLSVTRKTAAAYLSALEREGFLASEKLGRERIYVNKRLYSLVRDHNY